MTDDRDYSNDPVSLSSARATTKNDCTLWSPRDALIDILRDLDAGKIDPVNLFIGFDRRDSPLVTGYCCAGASPHNIIGVATVALQDYVDSRHRLCPER